jgi:hypothetical protein
MSSAIDHALSPEADSYPAEVRMSDQSSELARALEANRILKKQNDELQKRMGAKLVHDLRFEVSQRKAVSVYGLQRYPVTLYKEQWRRLLDAAPALAAFIRENDAKLAAKGDAKNIPG